MSLSLTVHKYKQVEGRTILEQVTPYIAISHATEGGSERIFIQGGRFFHEGGGDEVRQRDLPSWVGAEIKKLSLQARKDVGLVDWEPPEPEDD